jgi:hypothetical protein
VQGVGFPTVLTQRVARTIGVDNLPSARGRTPDPGVFVTLGMDAMQVFDREPVPLEQGRPVDRTVAAECAAGCSAVFFDLLQAQWLAMVVESITRTVRVPEQVHIAADGRVPVSTFLDVAYAVSETRPVVPPLVTIAVSSAGRGVQVQPVFLLPPEGLELAQGAAALGFTIKFGTGGITVDASDPSVGRARRIPDLKQLASMLTFMEKRHPNKEVVILQPDASVTVAELVAMIEMVKRNFPRIVLSQGQEIVF